MIVVVDTGPLYAAADLDDADHDACVNALEAPGRRLVIPALVVTEAAYLVAHRMGARAEATFLRGLEGLDVEAPTPSDWPRIARLVEKYADFPLGATDASVVVLAENLRAEYVLTLDHRHFGAVKPKHCRAFHLLP